MATAARHRSQGRRAFGLVAALAISTGACSSGDDAPSEPYTGCPASGAQAPGPGPETVLAGGRYSRSLQFPPYPCVRELEDCYGLPGGPQICIPRREQGQCIPRLTLLRAPAGASAEPYEVVLWQTARANEGVVADFEVETQYPAPCMQQRRAWTVTVLPAPAAPVLRSVTFDKDVVREGERVSVVADFENGIASWLNTANWDWFGVLQSGVPASSPPLLYSGPQPIAVRVVNEIGELAEQTRVVQVWGLPTARFTAVSPQVFLTEAVVNLSWEVTNATSVDVSPVPDSMGAHSASHRITETTTFRLTARNPFGDAATAEVTVAKVPPAVIHSLTAVPSEVAVGESPSIVATFSNGTGRLYAVRGGSPGAKFKTTENLGVIESGVPFVAPPQRGVDLYRLVVTDGVTADDLAELIVSTKGAGSFIPLAGSGRPTVPIVAALTDGRVLTLAQDPVKTTALFPEILDVDARTATSSASGVPLQASALAILVNGRAVASGWPQPTLPSVSLQPFFAFDPTNVASGVGYPSAANYAVYGPKTLVPLDGASFLSVGASVAWRFDTGTHTDGEVWGAATGPACRLADGRVLTKGGRVIYEPATGAIGWVSPGIPIDRTQPFLVCLADGSALLAGGFYASTATYATEIERFDPAASSWSVLTTFSARRFGAGVELTPGRVLLIDWSEGWVLDMATRALTRAGRFGYLRGSSGGSLSAIRLPDGRAVIHGPGGPVPEVFTP